MLRSKRQKARSETYSPQSQNDTISKSGSLKTPRELPKSPTSFYTSSELQILEKLIQDTAKTRSDLEPYTTNQQLTTLRPKKSRKRRRRQKLPATLPNKTNIQAKSTSHRARLRKRDVVWKVKIQVPLRGNRILNLKLNKPIKKQLAPFYEANFATQGKDARRSELQNLLEYIEKLIQKKSRYSSSKIFIKTSDYRSESVKKLIRNRSITTTQVHFSACTTPKKQTRRRNKILRLDLSSKHNSPQTPKRRYAHNRDGGKIKIPTDDGRRKNLSYKERLHHNVPVLTISAPCSIDVPLNDKASESRTSPRYQRETSTPSHEALADDEDVHTTNSPSYNLRKLGEPIGVRKNENDPDESSRPKHRRRRHWNTCKDIFDHHSSEDSESAVMEVDLKRQPTAAFGAEVNRIRRLLLRKVRFKRNCCGCSVSCIGHPLPAVRRKRLQKRRIKKRRLYAQKWEPRHIPPKKNDWFDVTCSLMLGTWYMNRHPTKKVKITEEGMRNVREVHFPTDGYQTQPKHGMNSFWFKDYAPHFFSAIKALCGISKRDYVREMGGELPFVEFISNSKSGQYFFFTRSQLYMVKTITKAEANFFIRVFLYEYYQHLLKYPSSLMVRVLGIHRIKIESKKKAVYFIVMNNVGHNHELTTTLQPEKSFDLKGSLIGRRAKDFEKELNKSPIFKDLDFLEESGALQLTRQMKEIFIMQLKKDTELLSRFNLMDYSVLLAVSRDDQKPIEKEKSLKPKLERNNCITLQKKQRCYRPICSPHIKRETLKFARGFANLLHQDLLHQDETRTSSSLQEIKAHLPVADRTSEPDLNEEVNSQEEDKMEEKPGTENFTDKSADAGSSRLDLKISLHDKKVNDDEAQILNRKGLFTKYKGGLLSRDGKWVYHIGIIDVLTKYSALKRTETVLKYFSGRAIKKISAVPPRMYRKRLIKFMDTNIAIPASS